MTLALLAFLALVLIGMPVAFAFGIAGIVFFLQQPELPISVPIQLTVSATQNFALLAIPLFIIAGNFLNHGGLTERLLRLALMLTGRLRGGLAQVSVALATLMGGVSGSCIADAAMQSRMLGQEMIKRGFPRGYAAAVLSWGSILTPLIPPGIGYILYGTVGQVSIGRLFAAGVIPALLMWAALALAIGWTAGRRQLQPELARRPTVREVGSALGGGIWALLFPVLLLAGLRFGVFTPSEIGAFAVVYAVAVGAFAYRALGRRSLREALEGSMGDIGAVMFLIALSAIFSYGIVFERIPELVSEATLRITREPHLIMALIVLLVLAAGTLIDGSILIVMLTPIFLPLAQEAGIDPVHFGIVFVIAATVSNFTPPVGSAMYAVCSILRCPVAEYTRASPAFLLAITVITLLVIAVPPLALWLPNLLFGQ
ncbi:MAG TPA: TRAP transporter large permease subunit [Burkholderiaceae bacterium]|jgi:tripartite ATP-independent transporter DctM subunit|nr:TRAP transporter large permease subunit [Burkholderiaceae bacterium]